MERTNFNPILLVYLCVEIKCKKCKKTKSIADFRKRSSLKSGVDSQCKDCRGLYERKHYLIRGREKIEYKIHQARKRRLSIRQKHYDFLKSSECIDCGIADPIVLEFDHLRDKEENIAVMVAKGNKWDTILREIEKCEIVCSNCHKKRTAKRSGWYGDLI